MSNAFTKKTTALLSKLNMKPAIATFDTLENKDGACVVVNIANDIYKISQCPDGVCITATCHFSSPTPEDAKEVESLFINEFTQLIHRQFTLFLL